MSKKEVLKKPLRMPVRVEWLELNGTYSGWQVQARVNPTMKTTRDIASGDFSLMIPALASIMLDWNFVDEEGNDLGPPSADTVELLPIDLVNTIAEKIVEVVASPPKA